MNHKWYVARAVELVTQQKKDLVKKYYNLKPTHLISLLNTTVTALADNKLSEAIRAKDPVALNLVNSIKEYMTVVNTIPTLHGHAQREVMLKKMFAAEAGRLAHYSEKDATELFLSISKLGRKILIATGAPKQALAKLDAATSMLFS